MRALTFSLRRLLAVPLIAGVGLFLLDLALRVRSLHGHDVTSALSFVVLEKRNGEPIGDVEIRVVERKRARHSPIHLLDALDTASQTTGHTNARGGLSLSVDALCFDDLGLLPRRHVLRVPLTEVEVVSPAGQRWTVGLSKRFRGARWWKRDIVLTVPP